MAVDPFGVAEIELPYGRALLVSNEQPDDPAGAIEFRHLRYFVSVAEELHFGRAASRMFMTQPALSQAITRLERALDVDLFVRTRHSVELTNAGTELLHDARRLLTDRNEVVERVRKLGHGEAGVLRLGVALRAEHEVADTLAAFGVMYPRIMLDRVAAMTERLLTSVQDHSVHAAFVHQLPVLTTLDAVEWEVVRRTRLAILVSQASPLAKLRSVTLSDLRGETFLMHPRELAPKSFEALKTMCRVFGGFDPEVLESPISTLPLDHDWRPLIEGDAVAAMSESTARSVQPAGTVTLPIQTPPQFVLALAWPRSNRPPIFDRFLAFVRAYRDEHAWAEAPPS